MLLEILFSDGKTPAEGLEMKVFQVSINGKTYRVTVEEVAEEAIKENSECNSVETFAIDENINNDKTCFEDDNWVIDSGNIIKAPMAGIVVDMLVNIGTEVEKGDLIAVLEAMKMENELRSHRGGKVKEILVINGQFVNQGDIIIVFE